MTRKQERLVWVGIAIVVLGAAGAAAQLAKHWLHVAIPVKSVTISGAVLRQDIDPQKQSPIANARVTVTSEDSSATAQSDASGFFTLTLQSGPKPGGDITLDVKRDTYKPVKMTELLQDRLYVVRMEPMTPEALAKPGQPAPATTVAAKPAAAPPKPIMIKDVRVRYPVKNQTTIDVGSVAKRFDVVNKGNIPCRGHAPCSPDGKWKATLGGLTLDAQPGNEFRNVRVSCVAGPCPFTKVNAGDLSRPIHTLKISVLNWSDTTSFLLEAEETRSMVTDLIRQSYPFIIGQTMSFALPAAAEGPTVEADLNGEEIIFPLGPNLTLSWATCSSEPAAGSNTLYRCELKPGYDFQ